LRQYANLLGTMLIGGLWHGAGLAFARWGGLHGVMLAANHLWQRHPRYRPLPALLAWLLTFLAVVLAWVPFRAADLGAALEFWAGLAGQGLSAHQPTEATIGAVALVSACLGLAVLAPSTQTLLRR
jgi:alginate O-acetyltransferase complex protein AlgI